jgi:hypothetical protein
MLYSAQFYRALTCLLGAKGKLYHYVGDPQSAHGARVARGVAKRLRDVGFEGVTVDAHAHGVVAANEFVRATRSARRPGAAARRRRRGAARLRHARPHRRADAARQRSACAAQPPARLARSLDDDEADER